MGLIRRAWQWFGPRSIGDGWNRDLPISGVGDSGESVTATSALGLSAVWACANLISGTISSLPLQIYTTRQDGTRAMDRAHPLYPILHDSPNFDQSALDFWDYQNLSIELQGDGLSQILRGSDGRVVALVPIRRDAASVRRLPSGELEYRWTADGRNFIGSERDVLHIRGPGGDPLGGMSTLAFARNSFAHAQAAERAASGMFRNGLRPSAVIKFKEWLTPQQRETAERMIPERYAGAVNAGRPFVAEGGVEYQNLAISPEDAQMLQTRQFGVEEICRFFGVPPALIGHAGASTAWPTSVEQQVMMFVKFTLRRRLKRIEMALTKQLLTPADRARGVVIEFNIEGLLRGDSAARAAFYAAGLQAGWLVINEVRGWENLPSVPGGDTPRMQSQNVPITEAGSE